MNKNNEGETSATNNAEGKADESGNEQQSEQQPPAEEETKELTLDEWKAQQQQRIKPKFNIRKAGEGVLMQILKVNFRLVKSPFYEILINDK